MTTLRISYCEPLNIYHLSNPKTGAEKPATQEQISRAGQGLQRMADLAKLYPGQAVDFEVAD